MTNITAQLSPTCSDEVWAKFLDLGFGMRVQSVATGETKFLRTAKRPNEEEYLIQFASKSLDGNLDIETVNLLNDDVNVISFVIERKS